MVGDNVQWSLGVCSLGSEPQQRLDPTTGGGGRGSSLVQLVLRDSPRGAGLMGVRQRLSQAHRASSAGARRDRGGGSERSFQSPGAHEANAGGMWQCPQMERCPELESHRPRFAPSPSASQREASPG